MTVAIMSSCSKDDDVKVINKDISISPESGPKNTVVTISGIAFGTDATKVKVFFNDMEAEVQSVTDNQIEAIVPVKAGTGLVKIKLDGADNFGPEFTYTLIGEVTTFAGTAGNLGLLYLDGVGADARFNRPNIAIGPQGNLWVADILNRKIRKVTPEAVVSTFAISMDVSPHAITVDGQGNLYIIDDTHLIQKITPNGDVSIFAGSTNGFADGSGANAQFSYPSSIAVDGQGNVYVADVLNNKIRKITPNGMVSTLAGSSLGSDDGTGTNAKFKYPEAVAVDANGFVYVTDTGNNRIRKITPNGEVTTIAGSAISGYGEGTGVNARFNTPAGINVDSDGNVYVSDLGNYAIRKITPEGVVSTLAGGSKGIKDGAGYEAEFFSPTSLVVDAQGSIYVAETAANIIRKITQE